MRYRVFRELPYDAEVVLGVLADLRGHFTASDPYHHDLRFLTQAEQGLGAKFEVRHTYWPVFPFAPDRVECTVTDWAPGKRLVINERNERAYRNHTQIFSIENLGPGLCRLTYEILYIGIPAGLLPLRLWVDRKVLARMREKLGELAVECRYWEPPKRSPVKRTGSQPVHQSP